MPRYVYWETISILSFDRLMALRYRRPGIELLLPIGMTVSLIPGVPTDGAGCERLSRHYWGTFHKVALVVGPCQRHGAPGPAPRKTFVLLVVGRAVDVGCLPVFTGRASSLRRKPYTPRHYKPTPPDRPHSLAHHPRSVRLFPQQFIAALLHGTSDL